MSSLARLFILHCFYSLFTIQLIRLMGMNNDNAPTRQGAHSDHSSLLPLVPEFSIVTNLTNLSKRSFSSCTTKAALRLRWSDLGRHCGRGKGGTLARVQRWTYRYISILPITACLVSENQGCDGYAALAIIYLKCYKSYFGTFS